MKKYNFDFRMAKDKSYLEFLKYYILSGTYFKQCFASIKKGFINIFFKSIKFIIEYVIEDIISAIRIVLYGLKELIIGILGILLFPILTYKIYKKAKKWSKKEEERKKERDKKMKEIILHLENI